jgi:four helix bundle protein
MTLSRVTTVRSFQDLTVWQRAIDLSVQIYALTKTFPDDEIFGLTNQIRRASLSVSSNIAEGQGRNTTKDFIQCLCIARGSNAEVHSQLHLVKRLGLGTEPSIAACEMLTVEISKMLNSLIAALQTPTKEQSSTPTYH